MPQPKTAQETCVEVAVTLYQKRIIAYLFARFRNLELAREEAQNAFLTLARSECPEIENKEAWLITVSRNRAFRVLQEGKRWQPMPDSAWTDIPDAQTPSPAEGTAASERRLELLAHLDSLPERQQEVMRLIYLAGLKPADVARALDEKPNNIHQLHFAALAALRKRIRRN